MIQLPMPFTGSSSAENGMTGWLLVVHSSRRLKINCTMIKICMTSYSFENELK